MLRLQESGTQETDLNYRHLGVISIENGEGSHENRE